MKGPQHRDRSNGGAGKIGRDVLGDSRQPQYVDVQHLARATRRFEIFAAENPQTELEALANRGLLDDVRMTFELVSDGRPDEIGPVRIEPLLHHQIDLTEVDIAEVDRDFLGVGGFRAQLAYVVSHEKCPFSSLLPSV